MRTVTAPEPADNDKSEVEEEGKAPAAGDAPPKQQHTFKLQNVYPGGSMEYVSFRADHKQILANYDADGAMPIQFHAVQGKPGVFLMQNKCF